MEKEEVRRAGLSLSLKKNTKKVFFTVLCLKAFGLIFNKGLWMPNNTIGAVVAKTIHKDKLALLGGS